MPLVPIAQTADTFDFDTNQPGDYVFQVTDDEGCMAQSVLITLNPPEEITPATWTPTPVSCGATDNGRVIITPDATSGVPPYEINFNNTGWSSQTVYSNLSAGPYPYLVRDSRGCETPAYDIVIGTDLIGSPDAMVSPVVATCSGGIVEGSIQVTGVVGGTPNFTYILQDQFGAELFRIGPTANTAETFSNLIPGIYTVVTIDSLGCRDEDTVTVTQTTVTVVPDPVVPVCNIAGFSNTVEIFGGTGPFLIRLENDPAAPVSPNLPPRRHTFSGLQYGVTYTVEVTDTFSNCVYLVEIPPEDGWRRSAPGCPRARPGSASPTASSRA